jgi:hypothetical protein
MKPLRPWPPAPEIILNKHYDSIARESLAELTQPDREAALKLQELMSDISEELWFAEWLIGTEDALWSAVQGGASRWGIGLVTKEQVNQLQRLSKQAGGWWYWDNGHGCTFIRMTDWLKMCKGAK